MIAVRDPTDSGAIVPRPIHSEVTLVNGSSGDPVLYVDYPDRDNALLFDAGDVARLPKTRIADLDAVFLTHHHADHFMDLDRVIRANLDSDKTLHLFGPEGTIERVYDRIRSYAHSYFPFQKLVLEISDLHPDRIETAKLEYQRRFPRPTSETRTFPDDGIVFENETVRVRTVAADHTVPCWSYALEEKPGYRFRYERLGSTSLRPGPWIGDLIREAGRNSGRKQTLSIDGGIFQVQDLIKRFLQRGGGFKMVWMVDTRFGGTADEGLLGLASGCDRLFCDCFYAEAQAKAAERHKHMTTQDAVRFIDMVNPKYATLVHFSGRYQGRYRKLVDEVRAQVENEEIRIEAELD